MFAKLFGKPKEDSARKGESVTTSIQNLRNTDELLEKKEDFLSKKIKAELDRARQYSQQKNKAGALQCLKKKKMYEGQIAKIQGSRLTLSNQIMALESAAVNREALGAMQEGARALKNVNKDLNIDKVDDTMDEIREQMDLANEVGEAIAQPVGGDMIDEDDLEAELDELNAEMLDEQLLDLDSPATPADAKATPSLPDAPTNTHKEEEDETERELRELQAQMAM